MADSLEKEMDIHAATALKYPSHLAYGASYPSFFISKARFKPNEVFVNQFTQVLACYDAHIILTTII